MKGSALSRNYYQALGLPMLRKQYPDYLDRIAAGFVGEGSECFGYDDEVSADHDFGPRFCLWLMDEDADSIGQELEKSYQGLATEFMGYPTDRNNYHSQRRHGVMRISEFYRNYTGSPTGPRDWSQWLSIPDYFLAVCTNGEVFMDRAGTFTEIRNHILHHMPEDVRKKKIAAKAFAMAQSGQYNFSRCIRHQEPGAAYLALGEFVTAAIQLCFLLNRRHCPYYKWMFRGLSELPLLSELHGPLLDLLTNRHRDPNVSARIIEDVCGALIRELRSQGLTDGNWDYLEPHAFRIQDSISHPDIRALHITYGK